MGINNIADFKAKWGGAHSESIRELRRFIDEMDKAIEQNNLAPMMVADMHQVIAHQLYTRFAEAQSEGGTPYGELSPGTTFMYGGFEFVKPNDEATYVRPIGGGGYIHFSPGTNCLPIQGTQP